MIRRESTVLISGLRLDGPRIDGLGLGRLGLVGLGFAGLGLTGLGLVSPTQVEAQTRYTFVEQAGREARGILRPRGDECFIITPAHAVEMAQPVALTRDGGRRAQGTVVQLDVATDLAIVQADATAAAELCRAVDPWPSQSDVGQAIERGDGVLSIVNDDGSSSQIRVQITERDPLRQLVVSPLPGQQPLLQGYSGAALVIDGVLAGMLVSVISDTASRLYGGAFVTRLDFMRDVLSREFPTFSRKSITVTGFAAGAVDHTSDLSAGVGVLFYPGLFDSWLGIGPVFSTERRGFVSEYETLAGAPTVTNNKTDARRAVSLLIQLHREPAQTGLLDPFVAVEAGFTLNSDDRALEFGGPFFPGRDEVSESGPLLGARAGVNLTFSQKVSGTLGVRYVRTRLKTIGTVFNAYGAAGGEVNKSTVGDFQVLFGINWVGRRSERN